MKALGFLTIALLTVSCSSVFTGRIAPGPHPSYEGRGPAKDSPLPEQPPAGMDLDPLLGEIVFQGWETPRRLKALVWIDGKLEAVIVSGGYKIVRLDKKGRHFVEVKFYEDNPTEEPELVGFYKSELYWPQWPNSTKSGLWWRLDVYIQFPAYR